MNKVKFWILLISIFILSVTIAVIFGDKDAITLFIASLGSIGTIATLYLAFIIFLNYSASADIQKKQFLLVEEAYTVLISTRFFIKTKKIIYPSYLITSRIDHYFTINPKENIKDKKLLISQDFYEFLLGFQNKSDQLYFPPELKLKIEEIVPASIETDDNMDLNTDDYFLLEIDPIKDKALIGMPLWQIDTKKDTLTFLMCLLAVKDELQDFINKRLSKEYQVNN